MNDQDKIFRFYKAKYQTHLILLKEKQAYKVVLQRRVARGFTDEEFDAFLAKLESDGMVSCREGERKAVLVTLMSPYDEIKMEKPPEAV